jgi:hypothetical protein
MRVLAILIGAWLAAGLAQAQVGYDRKGGDYTFFKVPTGDPAACAARCEREARCRAWNFAYPRTANASAICWLKNSVPPPVADSCCVSGVRGAGVVEPRARGTEFSIDRVGGDYRSFDVPTEPNGAGCESTCKGDDHCRAWTYVRPGYISAAARCYLKDKIKQPRRKPCCISGVIR